MWERAGYPAKCQPAGLPPLSGPRLNPTGPHPGDASTTGAGIVVNLPSRSATTIHRKVSLTLGDAPPPPPLAKIRLSWTF